MSTQIPDLKTIAAKTAVQRVTVTDAEEGQRVDNFLSSRMKGIPRSHLYKVLRSGEVRVNGGRVKASTRLSEGDEVRIPPIKQPAPGEEVTVNDGLIQRMRDAVLFEDEAIIVINKPSGMAVHGGSGISLGLIEVARRTWPKDSKLELVHRLDRDTSGCLLLARTRPALLDLQRQLRDHLMSKEYTALCVGRWPKQVRVVDAPLERNQLKSGERMVKVSGEGKAAESRFKILQHLRSATLLSIQIVSGRTHQIRVHAQLVGHPLAGDEKYGDDDANRELRKQGLKRIFLHAGRVQFRHPISGDLVEVTADLPEDLQNVVQGLS